MSFADNLRNIKPISQTEIFSNKVQYMCNLITINDIKKECTEQARRGARRATVKKEIFQTQYGTSFSINFERRPLFKFKKSGGEDLVERIVQNSIESKASSLGLNLINVNCVYSSNGEAPSSYIIAAVFSW